MLELDSTLEGISIDHLGLEPGPWLTTTIGDARLTIRDLDDGFFDVVVGDAFSGRTVPWHLTTVEFLTDVRDKLNDSGFYVMNTIDHPPTRFARAEECGPRSSPGRGSEAPRQPRSPSRVRAARHRQVFPYVAVVAPEGYLSLERGGNFVLVGSMTSISPEAIERFVPEGEIVLVGDAARAWFGDANPLTDDLAPVDQLISRP